MELSVFCSCAWSLTVLWLGGPTPSKFQPGGLSVQRRFHLCINACSADTFTLSSGLSQCSAHWVWRSPTVGLGLLCRNCSLFCIRRISNETINKEQIITASCNFICCNLKLSRRSDI